MKNDEEVAAREETPGAPVDSLTAAIHGVDRFTPAEWHAAYHRAVLLWHQIEMAHTSDLQKNIIALALLQFRASTAEGRG